MLKGVFLELPTMFRASCSRIGARHGSGTRNGGRERGLTGNVCRISAARCFRIVNLFRIWQGNCFVTYILNLSRQLTQSRMISFLDAWTNHNFFACLVQSASSQQIVLDFSTSWQSFAWFFHISNSPHSFVLLLWTWSADWFHCCSFNRWDSSSWLTSSKSGKSKFLFFQCFTSTSASAFVTLLNLYFLLARPIQPSA